MRTEFGRRWLVSLLAVLCLGATGSQAQPAIPAGQVDIFVGADFNFRDLYHNGRVYDILLNHGIWARGGRLRRK